MRVRIENQQFTAPTATALIKEIAWMHWGMPPVATAEDYIRLQQKTYRAVTDREMVLPDGDTEQRAIAMFKAIAETGGWDFSETD